MSKVRILKSSGFKHEIIEKLVGAKVGKKGAEGLLQNTNVWRLIYWQFEEKMI